MMLNVLLSSFLFDWYHKMVSPQNGDTPRGTTILAPPPPFATSRSSVATRGARGPCHPLTTACAPPFWFNQNTVFGTSRNGKTTADNNEKKNNYVQTYSRLTFSRFFAKLLAINCCKHLTQQSVSLRYLYGYFAEEKRKPAESLPVVR